MKKEIVCILWFPLPLAVSAAKVHQITPITTDKDIKIEIALSAEANERIPFTATISHTQNKELLCEQIKEFSFTHKVDTTIVWKIEELSPRLWSPITPELYNLELHTGTDTFHKRIGFRKFETRDGVFYLNDKPIYLRGNAINPPQRGIPEHLEKSKDFARDYVRFMKSIHINIIRIPDDQN